MSKKEELLTSKKKGTKRQYKETMQNRRVRSFLNQKLGTKTHISEKDYVRSHEKARLRRANNVWV